MPKFKPNAYQQAIFDAVACGVGNLVVLARAGTGKTTTSLQAIEFVKAGLSVLFCAFNKTIQVEISEKLTGLGLGGKVDARTLHSLGFGCVRRQGKFRVDGDKTRKMARAYLKQKEIYVKGRLAALCRLIGLGKNTLTHDRAGLEQLAWQFGVQDEDNPAHVLARQAEHLIGKCMQFDGVIDYDDMIWLPAVHEWRPKTYDVVFVDECQDLNPCQLWMIAQTLRRGGRLIAVGDDRQAIYGWRGAGSDVIESITEQFECEQLPLSITYRCPKSVVEIARSIVPDYQAADTAPDGVIDHVTVERCAREAAPGDFVLSRKNAPLMSMCLSILKRGVPAVVAGRDIGRSLSALAEKSEQRTVEELYEWLDTFLAAETKRLKDQESALEAVVDKIECLKSLCEGYTEVADVIDRIDSIFSDNDPGNQVVCSSVHKAKGLERRRVFVLEDTFRLGHSDEEDNIYYVAITRAQERLTFVG